MDGNNSFLSVPSVAALTGLTPQHCSSSQPGALSSQDAPATSSTPPEDDEMDSGSSSCSASCEKTSDTMNSTSDSRSASFASQDSDGSSNSDGSSAIGSSSGSSASDSYSYGEYRAQDMKEDADEIEPECVLASPADDDFSMTLKRRLHALISRERHDERQSEDLPEPQHPPGLVVESSSVVQYAHIPGLINTKPAAALPPQIVSNNDATTYQASEPDSVPGSCAVLPTTDSHLARQQNCKPPQAHISSQNLSMDFPGQPATSTRPVIAQGAYSPSRAAPLKRSRSTNDALAGPVTAKRVKMDGPAHSDRPQQTYDEKENIHPTQGAAQPLQNAIVRSRSRLALSMSLRRSTSSKVLIATQASAVDEPFADVPASLRKAGSLRSDPESEPHPPKVGEEDELVPTEPNTPFPVISPSVLRSPALSSQSSSAEPGSADARLLRLCERAKVSRARICVADDDGGDAALFEDAFVIGSEMRLRIVEWLLTFLPSKRRHPQLYDQLATSPETRFQAVALFLACLKQTVKESNWGEFVDERIRKRLVADEAKEGGSGLGDQAGTATGTQTSAHDAEYDYETDLAEYEAEELVDGLRLIVWDTAVGALALSVKFHRDNLPPLLPIYADEFTAVAPHEMDYQIFEECQRDVLRSVNYTFGVTPQPLMDNLWLAVPELQSVLDYETQEEAENQQTDANQTQFSKASRQLSTRRSGCAELAIWRRWNAVRRRAWEMLFRGCRAPDLMRYDAAYLTAAAILRALIDVCAMQEEVIDPRWNIVDARRAGLPKEGAHQSRWVRRAKRRILREHVEDMVCDAMGLREQRLKECQNWLGEVLAA